MDKNVKMNIFFLISFFFFYLFPKEREKELPTLIAAMLRLALQKDSSTCVRPSPIHVMFLVCTPCPQTPFLKEKQSC